MKPAGTVTDRPIVPSREREVEMARDQVIPGLESVRAVIFRSPEGTTTGPFSQEPPYLCFTKLKDLGTSVTPLGQVADSIRRILVRRELDIQEANLETDLASRFALENHLDYARYGLIAAVTENPGS